MKKLLATLCLLSLSVFATAHAGDDLIGRAAPGQEKGPLWTCEMDFKAESKGAQFFVGYFKIKGKGKLRCISLVGDTRTLPITIKMKSKPLAARIAFGRFIMYGTTGKISLAHDDPMDLLGKYRVINASAVVAGGVGTFTGVHAHRTGLTLSLSLQGGYGFGVNLGYNKLEIELDEDRL